MHKCFGFLQAPRSQTSREENAFSVWEFEHTLEPVVAKPPPVLPDESLINVSLGFEIVLPSKRG